MRRNCKPVSGRDLFLQFFNVAVLKFHNEPALRADHMIMMAFVDDVVVVRLSAEMPLLSNAGITEQVERPVKGGQSDVRFVAAQCAVQLFRRHVLFLKKRIQNDLALFCHLEAMLGQVVPEARPFLRMFHSKKRVRRVVSTISEFTSQARSRGTGA